jgi:hypothetical protein
MGAGSHCHRGIPDDILVAPELIAGAATFQPAAFPKVLRDVGGPFLRAAGRPVDGLIGRISETEPEA